MKKLMVLDCTLRDGGRIIDCAFGDALIRTLAYNLTKAKIDIVEMGFLRDWRNVTYNGNSTFFTDTEQIAPFIPENRNDTSYVAFVDYGMFDFTSLKPMDGKSINGIRVGFTKNDYSNNFDNLIKCMKFVKEQGYQLYIQGVNSLNYSDREMLEIVELINELQPASFGVVDTYGSMYIDDVTRLYNLIDHNMREGIAIDFHSHNNFQLSFSFAQEIIRLNNGVRPIIIDATLSGMGKGSGNLNTELLLDFLVRKRAYDYDMDVIFDTIDECLYDLKLKHQWGYSTGGLMSGVYSSHPNNVIYLIEKYRLSTKDIRNILSLLSSPERQGYNYDNLDRLCLEYSGSRYDDTKEMEMLAALFSSKVVLMLVPGASLADFKSEIETFINRNNPIVISVNFISEYMSSLAFFANKKRYMPINDHEKPVIVTSDVFRGHKNEIRVNYGSLICCGHKYFNNSAVMALNLLKRLKVKEIMIAGMDGFSKDSENNYFDSSFNVERMGNRLDEINENIAEMLAAYMTSVSSNCKVSLLTPSIFEGIIPCCERSKFSEEQ